LRSGLTPTQMSKRAASPIVHFFALFEFTTDGTLFYLLQEGGLPPREGLCRPSWKPSQPHAREEVRSRKCRQAQGQNHVPELTRKTKVTITYYDTKNATPTSGENGRLTPKPFTKIYHDRSVGGPLPTSHLFFCFTPLHRY